MAVKHVLLCSLALVLVIQESAAIKCVRCAYHPEADVNKACLPDATTPLAEDCGTGYDVCTLDIFWVGDGAKSYVRACGQSEGVSNGKKNSCDSSSLFNHHRTRCVCDKEDGCNGASSVTVSVAVAVVSAVTAMAWARHM